MYLFGNISISGWCRVRGYPHYINTPRYAGLYSRDIIAMVAGGEGMESHSHCLLLQSDQWLGRYFDEMGIELFTK